MKKLILCLVLSTLSVGSFAGEDRQERYMERMEKKLELTADQQTQLKAIYDKNAAERKALRESMHRLHESTNNDIRAILTPEQQAKFDKMKERRKQKHMEKKNKHHTDHD